MLSSSREHLRWAVVLAGGRYVVDVTWPGFDNQVAVDGVVVERWSWPGNNLYTTRSFNLHGVPCTIARRRTGLLGYAFELRVSAPGAVVEEIDAVGVPGAWHPCRSFTWLALLLIVLALTLIGGIAIGVVVSLGGAGAANRARDGDASGDCRHVAASPSPGQSVPRTGDTS